MHDKDTRFLQTIDTDWVFKENHITINLVMRMHNTTTLESNMYSRLLILKFVMKTKKTNFLAFGLDTPDTEYHKYPLHHLTVRKLNSWGTSY